MLNRAFRLIAASFFLVWMFVLPAAHAADVGIVLMHGKWGTPGDQSPIGKLKTKLEGAGFKVITPDMPWHRNRYLEKGYEESMAEIDAAVEQLKGQGAKKIVVGGHSMGANAAMGYGARRDGLAGVLAIAPGHIPGEAGYAKNFTADVAKAKDMIAAGKGAEKGAFSDINQGQRKEISASAEDYLSWFDPKGPAVMRTNTANLKAPIFWIIGSDDPMAPRGEAYAYAHAPKRDKNRYQVIDANHKNAPIKGASQIIEWLKGL